MEKNKNSGLIVLVIILVIGLVGSAGYIVYDKVLNKNDKVVKVENKKSNKKEIKIDSNKELVYDLVNKQVDGPAIGEKVELKLPYINIDSDYAKEVNKEISELQKDMEKKSNIAGNVFYKFFENENILSVLIIETRPNDYVYYYAYNFDEKTGKYVSNKELLDIKKYKKDNVIKKLEDYTMKEIYHSDDLNKAANNDSSTTGFDYEIQFANTRFFVKGILGYPMFINENNELCVMTYYAAIAGGGDPYSYIYNIDKNVQEDIINK